MTYSEKLKDPRWQKKRLEVLQRFSFSCCYCGSTEKTLHVHHRYYISGREPWNYPISAYESLCFECHESTKEGAQELQTWEHSFDYFNEDVMHDAMITARSIGLNGNDAAVEVFWHFEKKRSQGVAV
jgi:hypothetical protein